MKNIKNLSAFIGKMGGGGWVQGVHIMPDRIVATDSFKLVEIKTETGVTEAVTVVAPKALKTFDGVTVDGEKITLQNKGAEYLTRKHEGEFPAYEKVMPEGEPQITIRLQPQLLKEVAEAYGKEAYVDMHIYGELKPLKFENGNKDVTVLLMPMNNGK
jgi:hypothetical protein